MRILLMGDIHIGAIKDTNYVYNVMTEIIDKEVIFNKIDMIVIMGDYFDRLFRANEEYVGLAINVMTYIVNSIRKRSVSLRLIEGTFSHDANQYKLFNYFFNDNNLDIKLIKTVTEEEINGKKILYIPEEYVMDKNEFYREYLYSGKKYDYIFGHGNIIEGLPKMAQINNNASVNKEKQVPRFKSGELGSICKICCFSHVHIRQSFDNVHYIGSLFRTSFGEEGPKGYAVIEDDKLSLIENERAYIYKTYTFDEKHDIFKNNDNIIKEINKIKKENIKIFNNEIFGKIRLKLKLPNDVYSSFKDDLLLIINADKHISILMEESYTLEEDIKEDDNNEFDFILDKNIQIHEKIHSFIQKQYDYDLPINIIEKYITEPLKI